MNRTKLLVVVLVFLGVGVGCASVAAQGAQQPRQIGVGAAEPISAADLAKKIDDTVLRAHLGQFWGAVLVARDGEIVLAKGYGIENDSLKPIDADTVMDIGSIAKQFTAAAILRLEMDGVGGLSIDDPVSKWFPKAGLRAEEVTLKHLMSHTSGQPNDTIQRLDFPDRDEAVRRFFAPANASAPGEKFEYNNAGYVVLAAVIEKATGKEFAEYTREAIFKPAGLRQTGFLDGVGVDVARGAARVVNRGGRSVRLGILQDGWGWGFKGCGGVLTTMNDLARWDRALAGESVLNAAAKSKMFEVVRDNYALGWMVETLGDGRARQFHTGATRGFRAALSRVPAEKEGEAGWVVAVMTNERNDPIGIEKMVREAVFPGSDPRPRSVLYINGLKLNKHKLAELEDGVRLRVGAPDGSGGSVLTITHEEADQSLTVATIALDKAAIVKLKAEITRATDSADKRAKGVACVIATLPYTATEGRIELPHECTLRVMPRYVGVGEDGKPIIDERVTIVLMDEQEGFWPVILKLNVEATNDLLEQLRPLALKTR